MADLPPYHLPKSYRLLAEMTRIAASKARDPAVRADQKRLARKYEKQAKETAKAIRASRSS